MNTTAAHALVLVLIGGPVAMLSPFAIARLLVNQHADQVAADTTARTARKETRP